MKQGITLFSLTLEWLSARYTVEELLAEVSRRGLGPGVEIVGFQTIRDFPSITSEFAVELRGLFDKYELVPSCLSANVDVGVRRDRLLNEDETVEYVAAQIAAAKALDFPVLRIQVFTKPGVIRRLVPIAEKAGVVLGLELHSPYGVRHPAVLALRELFAELESPFLAFVPDMGVTMRQIPPGLIQSFREDGMSEATVELLQTTWHSQLTAQEKFARIREGAAEQGVNAGQLGRLNLALSMFSNQPPEDWLEVMPHVVHVHGKFYGFDEHGDDPSVDYGRLINVFNEGGYKGFMSSEWEGHAYTDAASGLDMVAQHQALCRRFNR